jgi:hypothetical protein
MSKSPLLRSRLVAALAKRTLLAPSSAFRRSSTVRSGARLSISALVYHRRLRPVTRPLTRPYRCTPLGERAAKTTHGGGRCEPFRARNLAGSSHISPRIWVAYRVGSDRATPGRPTPTLRAWGRCGWFACSRRGRVVARADSSTRGEQTMFTGRILCWPTSAAGSWHGRSTRPASNGIWARATDPAADTGGRSGSPARSRLPPACGPRPRYAICGMSAFPPGPKLRTFRGDRRTLWRR